SYPGATFRASQRSCAGLGGKSLMPHDWTSSLRHMAGDLSDDERFVLMEIILESFEDLGQAIPVDPRWHRTASSSIKTSTSTHSVWYWSDLENENVDDH